MSPFFGENSPRLAKKPQDGPLLVHGFAPWPPLPPGHAPPASRSRVVPWPRPPSLRPRSAPSHPASPPNCQQQRPLRSGGCPPARRVVRSSATWPPLARRKPAFLCACPIATDTFQHECSLLKFEQVELDVFAVGLGLGQKLTCVTKKHTFSLPTQPTPPTDKIRRRRRHRQPTEAEAATDPAL